jgi:hypothetical protein
MHKSLPKNCDLKKKLLSPAPEAPDRNPAAPEIVTAKLNPDPG